MATSVVVHARIPEQDLQTCLSYLLSRDIMPKSLGQACAICIRLLAGILQDKGFPVTTDGQEALGRMRQSQFDLGPLIGEISTKRAKELADMLGEFEPQTREGG